MTSLTSDNLVCSSSKWLQKTSDCKKSGGGGGQGGCALPAPLKAASELEKKKPQKVTKSHKLVNKSGKLVKKRHKLRNKKSQTSEKIDKLVKKSDKKKTN